MANIGYPDISANSLGQIAVAFPAFFGSIKQIYVRTSDDNGTTWNTIERPTTSMYECDNPSIHIDEKGNIAVVYEVLEDGYIKQFYETHKLSNATSWSTPIKVGDRLTHDDGTPLSTTRNTLGSENVVTGDFEGVNWAFLPPTGWNMTGTPTLSEYTADPYAGSSSLYMTSSDSSNYISQDITISLSDDGENSQYLLSGYLKAGSGDKAVLEFELLHGKTVTLESEDTDWTFYSQIVEASHVEGSAITIKLYGDSASDEAYFDNISVKKIVTKKFPQVYPNILGDDNIEKGHVNILYGRDNFPSVDIRIKSHNLGGGADITEDVKSVRVSRDMEFKTGIYGAGDFSMTIDNSEGLYSNEKNESPFFKRLRSGIEVGVQVGVREYNVSGTGDITDPDNWDEELFPSIVGVASKFSQNSKSNLITISGRDRADKFMSYKNFTSELYETIQAIELIGELANEDDDLDGFGDTDASRPTIQLSEDTSQQTLTGWDRKLIGGGGTSTGDAGSSTLTNSILKELPVVSQHSGESAYYLIGAWIDRSGSTDYVYTLTRTEPSDHLYLDKWSGWESAESTLVHESGADVSSSFPAFGYVGAGPSELKVTPYDADHDCVWCLYHYWDSSASLFRLVIAKYDFKTDTYTQKILIHSQISGGPVGHFDKCGSIIYDSTNSKLWISHLWNRSPAGTGTGWPRYGVYSIDGSENVTQDFFSTFQDDGDGTPATGVPETAFPTCGINVGDYYYLGIGYQSDRGGPVYNYKSFGAIRAEEMNVYDFNLFSSTNFNTALCWVCHPYSAGIQSWDQATADAGTQEAFFDDSIYQRRPVLSLDYDDNFLYLFCTDDMTGVMYPTGGPTISANIEIRKCASRIYYTAHTNIMAEDHTTAEGYTDNDTDTVWFPEEELRVENDDISEELNYSNEYDSEGVFTLTGDSDQTSGMPTIPTDDYQINLETGEILFQHFFDKENTLLASYDYKYSVPYAWFEDESLWDGIQEIASAGDFICYVNEDGELVFKDRFRYYYPEMSQHETALESDATWDENDDPYEFTDANGDPITNIIPGLEFVMSMNPNKDTGKFKVYKRRSYKTNGVAYISTHGDYDIDYDTGEIGWNDTGDIPSGERVMIYFYNRDYLFNFSYDSNVLELSYNWGADRLANRVTVKGERYYPSESPISVREVYVVNPGENVVNTKFSSIKQLAVGSGATDIDQKQFDTYSQQWRDQTGSPSVDLEFRTKLIGDTERSRDVEKAIQLRVIPCKAPGEWADAATTATEIPDDAWVGQGYKINWSTWEDTGVIDQPNSDTPRMNITGVELKADGLKISVDHLEKDNNQYFVQVELIGYTLTRVGKFTALHEDLASIKRYYPKSYELDNRFISDMDMAKMRARRLVHFLSEEEPEVEINALGSPHISLDDVVLVKDENTGLAGDYFVVVGIQDSISKDKYETRLKLRRICEVTTNNLGYENAISGYDGGYIDKSAIPIENFVEEEYNK